jgi:protein-S-isoprenylcysteine O-methyltransferase Ste14
MSKFFGIGPAAAWRLHGSSFIGVTRIVIIGSMEVLELIWVAWLISWIVASFWSSPMQKRVATSETWTYRAAIITGSILLMPWTARMLAEKRIWDVDYKGAYALAGMMLAGLLLTWWARLHLGRLWSSAITRKEDHRIVDTGPYALVRHPIYSGLITALLATSAVEATVTALLGVALIAFGLWLKARSEECFLAAELGPEAYRCYCRRVPMLVPFLPHR